MLRLLFLIEIVICLFFWVLNPMAGYIFTVAVSGVAAALLVIALIAERIEASKIGAQYYYGMTITVVTPLVVWGVVKVVF